MNYFCLPLIVGVVFFILAAGPSAAQLPTPTERASRDTVASREKSVGKAEADRIRKQRHSQARLLLTSLASDARSFRDQKLRARSLARIADALWHVDAEQGRTLFRKAWEAAEIADQEGQGHLNLRRGVLNLVARHDRLLAEEFLQKLKDQQEAKADGSKPNLWELPEALQHRLSLAESLLGNGDIERALQFADPVLGSVTISTVDFLSFLREKDSSAADQRYALMLANTSGNMLADANTISLLSSYIFTPHLYLIFNTQGGADSTWARTSFPPANVSPQLRLAFFQTASGVLMRPQPPPEQDHSTAGIAGKYLVVKRLLPLFEQYAPRQATEAMLGQLEALSSLISENIRQSENEPLQKGISERPFADQEQSLLDQIDHARTSGDRDELYFRLALLALSKGDLKARDYVSKIAESGFRKQTQAWVDAGLVISAIKNKKIEVALELARIGELTHIQRVWLLAQSAKLLANTDRDRALSLLEDAIVVARRIDGDDLNRPRGLLAIANALRVIEPSRAYDAIFEAVKAANSTEGFTGEGGVLTLSVTSKGQILKKTEAIPDFDIRGIFGEVASTDYDRAIELARGFQGEAPRANATIAIARAVLNEQSVPVSKPQSPTKN